MSFLFENFRDGEQRISSERDLFPKINVILGTHSIVSFKSATNTSLDTIHLD